MLDRVEVKSSGAPEGEGPSEAVAIQDSQIYLAKDLTLQVSFPMSA